MTFGLVNIHKLQCIYTNLKTTKNVCMITVNSKEKIHKLKVNYETCPNSFRIIKKTSQFTKVNN